MLKITDEALVLNKKNHICLKKLSKVSCSLVPNYVEESFICKKPKKIKLDITEAVFVGYVQPGKGIAEVYDLAKCFPNINFRLIGEVHDEVKSWIKPDNVHLLGKKNHSDIKHLQDEADVFIFLSHSEGFSLALLESMARGLPVLATDVGANAEMIENNGGIIVPVKDVEEAKKALTVLHNFEKRKKMSIWNIEKVMDNYTANIVMKRFKTIYEECHGTVKEKQ